MKYARGGMTSLDYLMEIQRLENELKKSEWVSVKDRLPESDKKVLITDGRNMMVSWYYRWNGMIKWVDTLYVRDITHWMPLPEPPKKDDENI